MPDARLQRTREAYHEYLKAGESWTLVIPMPEAKPAGYPVETQDFTVIATIEGEED